MGAKSPKFGRKSKFKFGRRPSGMFALVTDSVAAAAVVSVCGSVASASVASASAASASAASASGEPISAVSLSMGQTPATFS